MAGDFEPTPERSATRVAIEFDSDFGSCLGQKDAPYGLGRCSA